MSVSLAQRRRLREQRLRLCSQLVGGLRLRQALLLRLGLGGRVLLQLREQGPLLRELRLELLDERLHLVDRHLLVARRLAEEEPA